MVAIFAAASAFSTLVFKVASATLVVMVAPCALVVMGASANLVATVATGILAVTAASYTLCLSWSLQVIMDSSFDHSFGSFTGMYTHLCIRCI